MTRYRRRQVEVDAFQVPTHDVGGLLKRWSLGRRGPIRTILFENTDQIAQIRIEQVGDFPQAAEPGDYIVDFGRGQPVKKMTREELDRDYVRCG